VAHCGASTFPARECHAVTTRPAIDGETVEVRAERGAHYATVEQADLAGFVALERVAVKGDSGSGVFGADGALLGLIDRNVGDWTLLSPPPSTP
jgi:uncharacterized membrane protein